MKRFAHLGWRLIRRDTPRRIAELKKTEIASFLVRKVVDHVGFRADCSAMLGNEVQIERSEELLRAFFVQQIGHDRA